MVSMNVSIEEMKASLKKKIDDIKLSDVVECSEGFLKLAGQDDFERQINITITKDVSDDS